MTAIVSSVRRKPNDSYRRREAKLLAWVLSARPGSCRPRAVADGVGHQLPADAAALGLGMDGDAHQVRVLIADEGRSERVADRPTVHSGQGRMIRSEQPTEDRGGVVTPHWGERGGVEGQHRVGVGRTDGPQRGRLRRFREPASLPAAIADHLILFDEARGGQRSPQPRFRGQAEDAGDAPRRERGQTDCEQRGDDQFSRGCRGERGQLQIGPVLGRVIIGRAGREPQEAERLSVVPGQCAEFAAEERDLLFDSENAVPSPGPCQQSGQCWPVGRGREAG